MGHHTDSHAIVFSRFLFGFPTCRPGGVFDHLTAQRKFFGRLAVSSRTRVVTPRKKSADERARVEVILHHVEVNFGHVEVNIAYV